MKCHYVATSHFIFKQDVTAIPRNNQVLSIYYFIKLYHLCILLLIHNTLKHALLLPKGVVLGCQFLLISIVNKV